MQMADTDDLTLWYALNRLMTNYWADLDVNGGSQAHEFYLPDPLYAVGNNRSRGWIRSAPSMTGAGRPAPLPRVT
jgi:hypothetical protein